MSQYNAAFNTARRPRAASSTADQPLPSVVQLLCSPQPFISGSTTLPPLQWPFAPPQPPHLAAATATYALMARSRHSLDDFTQCCSPQPSLHPPPWHSRDLTPCVPPTWSALPLTEASTAGRGDVVKPDDDMRLPYRRWREFQ